MRAWDAEHVARASGARLVGDPNPAPGGGSPPPAVPGPSRAVIDSREAGPGDLFIGLPGSTADGGTFAPQALAAGAWGSLTTPELAESAHRAGAVGVLLAHRDPLSALHALATAWRRELGARVIGVTGSTGKTSTKDILAALLGQATATVASPANLNTEIGLPLAILAAPPGTQALVLELAMRGAGQIAWLAEICEPDVGVIVNVGPVHLELLGSLEAIAAAKAELIAGLRPGATAVIPAREPLLDPHRREDLQTVTFGEGGDVALLTSEERGDGARLTISTPAGTVALQTSFRQAHNLSNLLAAVAAAQAVGVTPEGVVSVSFSALRGERVALPGGVTLVNDCYNANPMSMVAALDELSRAAPGRTVAVLGDMLELGADEARFHREVGEHASGAQVDVLVTVGLLAAEMGEAFTGTVVRTPDAAAAARELSGLLRQGDTVLVKGSRGVGLERVAEDLLAAAGAT